MSQPATKSINQETRVTESGLEVFTTSPRWHLFLEDLLLLSSPGFTCEELHNTTM